MASMLIDLIAPGVGSPVVAVLHVICTIITEMHECTELCKRVYERLAIIYDKMLMMEEKRTLPREETVQKYAKLVGDYKLFLEKHRGKKWIYRVVTYKRVLGKVGDFQEDIATLMLAMNLCHMDAMADERVQMELFRQQQQTFIESRLTNDAIITKEMAQQVQQVEALSVLRHELQASNLAMSAEQTVLTTALDKVMRRSTVQVLSVPEWFLPGHKVEYDKEAFAGGSFGSVHHGKMGYVDVVVKCLLVDTRGNEGITEKFRYEAGLWFKFRHKHVLMMYGACDVSSPPLIVCEHATNGNLFNFLGNAKNKHLTFQLLQEAASGLAYLHENRVVHGDLKCDNILVGADRSAKIADFSFSYVRTLSASKASVAVTSNSMKAGALRWRAPECLKGHSPTFASDVFSFGMCIIEAVSQELPWGYRIDDDTVRDLVKSGELPDKPERMTDEVWRLVQRMCSFESVSRPSLEWVVENLGELAQDEAVQRVSLPAISAQPWGNMPVTDASKLGRDRDDSQTSTRLPTLVEKPIADSPAPNPVVEARQPQRPQATRDAVSLEDAITQDNVDALAKFLTSAADLEKTDSVGATPLILAAGADAIKVAEYLLSRGANVDAQNNSGATALYCAAYGGNLGAVRVLLKHKTDVNLLQNDGGSALFTAAFSGHVIIMEELMRHGAMVNARNNDGGTALYGAAQNGHLDAVRLLLQSEADVSLERTGGWLALHIAASKGHVAVVEDLLRYGAPIDAQNSDGSTALYCGAQNGHLNTVRVLLKHKADVTAKQTGGWSVLTIAAFNGHADVVDELIQHGTPINEHNSDGATALLCAARNGHLDAIRVLLKSEADVTAKQDSGWSALHIVASNGHADAVEELIQHGAIVDAQNDNGSTALCCASSEGQLGVVRVLIRCKADVNAGKKNGGSILHSAAFGGHADVIEELLRHGATADAQNNSGATALHIGAQSGTVDVVRVLLKTKLDVNAKDRDEWLPLHYAALNDRSNDIEIIEELVQHGATIDALNSDEKTALDLAVVEGKLEFVRVLLKNKASVRVKSATGERALERAAASGRADIACLLLDAGAKVTKAALRSASNNKHKEVSAMLKARASLRTRLFS